MKIKQLVRIFRLRLRKMLNIEPKVAIFNCGKLKAYGDLSYGGWKLPTEKLCGKIGVVDAGIGEEFSFSTQLIKEFNAEVVALDPTPRAAVYMNSRPSSNTRFVQKGVAATSGVATLFLPTNSSNVSGSIVKEVHVQGGNLTAEFITISDAICLLDKFDTLVVKLDIEGAEFDLIGSADFRAVAPKIALLCVEFHHRWPSFSGKNLAEAIDKLESFGFLCVWANPENNEEFTFARV